MINLLQKYIKGDCTSEENIQILNWIEESDAHLKEYQALRKLYDISVWNPNLGKQTHIKPSKNYFKIILRESLKVAATLIIGATLTISIIKQNTPEAKMQTVYARAGQRVELDLSDGTKVWLNSGSTLTFPDYFSRNTREVTLVGEGYFDVEKAESSKFIVQTEYFDVSVLGTEFNVKAYKQNGIFQVDLLEGSVEVSSEILAEPIKLKPNQSALYRNNDLTLSNIEDFSHFRWKEGLICFENETIESLFNKIELYYDVKINSENKELLKLSYSGKFWIKDGVEHILKVLQLEHKFDYEINSENKEINITN